MINIKVIFGVAGFVAGALFGGSAALIVSKKTYEKKMQDELDKVWADVNNIKTFKKPDLDTVVKEANIKPEPVAEPNPVVDYNQIAVHAGYNHPELKKTNDLIYEITENDLDEELYERIDLTLYADGILADDGDYPIRSLSDTVGDNFHQIFTPDKDEIFIRNEKRQIDHDVCRSQLSYGEMLDRHPETEQRLQFDDALERYYSEDADDEEDGEDDEE